ncbi:hypothetical protein V5799_021305 [Amblyomma americanum]|uniref:Uncharacterized protein n=1 Tax=Amblyomma americanum TaxID=6943 RepID=A0AAQ4FNX8_AMBAM
MMFICKISGCPFTDVIVNETRGSQNESKTAPIRRLLQVTYFIACVCVFSCIGSSYVMIRLWLSKPTDQITLVTQSGIYLIVYIQAVLNFLNLLLRRKQLADIVLSAAKLEPKLHLDVRVVRRRLWKVSLLCLLYTLVDALKHVVGLRGHIGAAFLLMRDRSEHVRRLFVPAYIGSCFLISAWYNVVFWQIVYFSSLFREYFAAVGRCLEDALSPGADARGLAAESVRLKLVELQRLLRKVNSFVGPQALWYYAGSVFYLCGMLYNAATSTTSATQQAIRWTYVAAMAAGVVLTTAAASRMSDEIAGAVITYTVVLVQTNESIVADKCLRSQHAPLN